MSKKPRANNLEIELKLIGGEEHLNAAWDILENAPNRIGDSKTRKLVAVYFDSPDGTLHGKGVSLRVRAQEDKIVQTLKAAIPDGGTIRRKEWNTTLPDATLNRKAFKQKRPRQLTKGLKRLTPVFETDVQRRLLQLTVESHGSPSIVEAAFDRGQIRTPRKSIPVLEIELELVRGHPAAVFDLAYSLNERLSLSRAESLHVETRSKFSRGWELSKGVIPAARKARPIHLDRSMSVEESLRVILSNCYSHWVDNQAVAIGGADPEGIHQLRIALRRLRVALAIFRKYLDPESILWINTEARWILHAVGKAREWDAFLQDIIPPAAAGPFNVDGLASLCNAAEAARDEAYDGTREVFESARYTSFFLRFGSWIEQRGWRNTKLDGVDKSITRVSRNWLAKTHTQTLSAGRNLVKMTPEERHKIRLRLKKLRYGSEFFESLYPRKTLRRYVKRVRRLQDELGWLNDLTLIEKQVTDLAGRTRGNDAGGDRLGLDAEFLLGWYAHHAEPALRDAASEWKEFRRAKPFWV
jgi:inorganic triphosphatase YgiF